MASGRVLALFGALGQADYIGEPVSILEHVLQAAALARQLRPDDEEFIMAALLHDVGHLLGQEAGSGADMADGNGVSCGTANHEALGGAFCTALGLPARTAFLVANHVSAKRWLVWKDPGYAARLTDASKTTLRHQGGPMTQEEAQAFEAHPEFEACVQLRSCDEGAKVPSLAVPSLATYAPLLDKHTLGGRPVWALSELQVEQYRSAGFVRVPGFLNWALGPDHVAILVRWTEELDALGPPPPRSWLRHREMTASGPQLCRMENFLAQHPAFSALCYGPLADVAQQLLGQPVALFKEKVNWKLPGGAGFEAHQDSPAYTFVADTHVSACLAVDASTPANGCLQVAPGRWAKGQVPLLPSNVIHPDAVASMAWEDLPMAAGDLVLFSGYLPHRSDSNTTDRPRRAAFITYCEAVEGRDVHAEYYKAKHDGAKDSEGKAFNAGATLSFSNDFKGTIVD